MIEMSKIFALIRGERSYQDQLNPKQVDVGCELALLRKYLRDSENVFAETFGEPNEQPTMDVFRKIAAMCVRAMQVNDAPARDIDGSLRARGVR